MIINCKIRKHLGKNLNKKLININKIPAILYGKNKKNINLILKNVDLCKFIKKYNINNKIDLYLIINKIKTKVIIKNIQYHHFKNLILHVDFLYI